MASVPTGLRRATASRVAASARQIREFEQENDVTIGPITRQHVAVRQARQPDGEAFAMPRDNTTRQAEFLDERRRIQQAEREAGRGDEADRNRKKIRIEVNGSWMDVWVDVTSLRRALGLPLHDLFDGGIFREYVHQETVGPDVEDTDHGAVAPAPTPAAAPTPRTVPAPEPEDSDSDSDTHDSGALV